MRRSRGLGIQKVELMRLAVVLLLSLVTSAHAQDSMGKDCILRIATSLNQMPGLKIISSKVDKNTSQEAGYEKRDVHVKFSAAGVTQTRSYICGSYRGGPISVVRFK